jgi:hypothetical protein
MRRRLWIAISSLLLVCGVVYAVEVVVQAFKPQQELTALLPEGALLSIEARDFSSLLHDWNSSQEKRAWLASDNHAGFSDSRLFTRLSQAQDEFSAAAGLPTDDSLLERVAGKESCLGLYDIGNLEFVYVSHLDQAQIEATPLWQMRDKFEQRTEAGSAFYVHTDAASSRTAAFAARDGWLILGTREDLVAGVLDRLAGVSSHSLASEGWYVETVKQAAGERGNLRMVLNLDKIVATPYFRSYWVQQNITEMKQYASAVSDLYRTSRTYREERVLLRRTGAAAVSRGDVRSIAALAPENAVFYAAQAEPTAESVVEALRDDLLEAKPERAQDSFPTAPAEATAQDVGRATQLDVRIDLAPVAVKQVDGYQSLRALLLADAPDALLEVHSTRATEQGVFVSLQSALVLTAPRDWDEAAACDALSSALPSGLTTARLGANWEKRTSAAGEYLALDGTVPLYLTVQGRQLLLANDSELMEKILARRQKSASVAGKDGVTYAALFQHTQKEQSNFRRLMSQMDRAGNAGGGDLLANDAGQKLGFFSGNVASFSRVFSNVESEQMIEKDQGEKVRQTVTYQWVR